MIGFTAICMADFCIWSYIVELESLLEVYDMDKLDFSLGGREFIELKNLLKVSGIAETGGQAKAIIGDSEVSVDGEIETRKACKIRIGQIVQLDGIEITVVE